MKAENFIYRVKIKILNLLDHLFLILYVKETRPEGYVSTGTEDNPKVHFGKSRDELKETEDDDKN